MISRIGILIGQNKKKIYIIEKEERWKKKKRVIIKNKLVIKLKMPIIKIDNLKNVLKIKSMGSLGLKND